MASCTVNYNLKDAGYQNYANQTIYFRIKSAGTDETATSVITRSRISSTSDANGDGSVTLWVNGDSGVSSLYEVTLPDNERIDFIIPTGTSSIELDRLIELYQPAGGEQQASVLNAAGDRTIHYGGPDDMDGNEIILDADGDTSITADTDDQIDIKIGGSDVLTLTATKAGRLNDIANVGHAAGRFIISDGNNWVPSGLLFASATGTGDQTIEPEEVGGALNYDLTVKGGDHTDTVKAGDLYALGGDNSGTGSGGNVYIRGGATILSDPGDIYIGDSNTDKIFWGSGAVDVSTITAYAATLLDDANKAAAQTTLGIAVPDTLTHTDNEVLTSNGTSWTAEPRAEIDIPSRAAVAMVQAATTDSGLSVPSAASVNVGTSDLSVFAWVKMPAGASARNHFILEKIDGAAGYSFAVTSTGGMRVALNGTIYSTSAVDLFDDKWHFLCVSMDRSGNATYYVDGVSVDTDDISANVSDDTDNTATLKFLDGAGSTSMSEGWMCNYVGLTKDILTASEVALIAADPHHLLELNNVAALIDLSQVADDVYIDRSSNAATVSITGTITSAGHVVPQSIDTTDSPTFADVTLTADVNIGADLNHDGSNIGFFGTAPTTQQTALTTQLTTITFTAPGTPDYALQDVTNTSPYGFADAEEARTFISVVKNLQDRVSELETKLQAYGLLA